MNKQNKTKLINYLFEIVAWAMALLTLYTVYVILTTITIKDLMLE